MYFVGPGALSRLNLYYPDECIGVNIGHKFVIVIHVRPVIIGVLRRMKMFIIILYKLVDFIKVIQIKIVTLIVTLNAKVYFDRFGKELCLIILGLGGFRIESQSWIVALTL